MQIAVAGMPEYHKGKSFFTNNFGNLLQQIRNLGNRYGDVLTYIVRPKGSRQT